MSKQILVSLKRGHPERSMRARLKDGTVQIINEAGLMLPEDQVSDEMRDCRWFLVGGELPEMSQPVIEIEPPQEPLVPPTENPPLDPQTTLPAETNDQAKAEAEALAKAEAKAAEKARKKAEADAAKKAAAKPKAEAGAQAAKPKAKATAKGTVASKANATDKAKK